MIVELLTLVALVIVIVVLFYNFSTENSPGSPGLTFMILAFGLFVGITLFFLARSYFQKSEHLLQFLLAFTMFLLFPISLSSAAATFVSIRTLKETIATA